MKILTNLLFLCPFDNIISIRTVNHESIIYTEQIKVIRASRKIGPIQ